MTDNLSDSGLGLVQRIVTGHDAQGQAVVVVNEAAPTRLIPTGDAAFLTIWSTANVPADNTDPADGGTRDTGLTLERGSVIRITDMLPRQASPFHRTNSIDYGIVLEGEVELELDDGARTTIRRGGIIVQRGTNHRWRNATDKPCRIAFVLIEASAYLHDGHPLTEAKPEDVVAGRACAHTPRPEGTST